MQNVYITDDLGKLIESDVRLWVAKEYNLPSGTTIHVTETSYGHFIVLIFPPDYQENATNVRFIEVTARFCIKTEREYSITEVKDV